MTTPTWRDLIGIAEQGISQCGDDPEKLKVFRKMIEVAKDWQRLEATVRENIRKR